MEAIETILQAIEKRVRPEAKAQFSIGLSTIELLVLAKEMVLEKNHGLDGYAIDFYTKFWSILGEDFTRMVSNSML